MSETTKIIVTVAVFLACHYFTGFVRLGAILQRPASQQPLSFVQGRYSIMTPLWIHFLDCFVAAMMGRSFLPKLLWWGMRSAILVWIIWKIVGFFD